MITYVLIFQWLLLLMEMLFYVVKIIGLRKVKEGLKQPVRAK